MGKSRKKTFLIATALVIALAAAILIMQKQASRPTLEDYEGTFRMSNRKYLELKANPTDEYDMTGCIYKEGEKASAKEVVGVYMPSGSLSIEDTVDSEDGVMIGILHIELFGRYKFEDVDTQKTLTLEKL